MIKLPTDAEQFESIKSKNLKIWKANYKKIDKLYYFFISIKDNLWLKYEI